MQIQTKKAQKPTTASGQQPYRESRGLYEMAGRSLTKSPRDEPYMQLRRLFVSAVLSLICILISPVLSTDALWNIISAATATGLETTMAGISSIQPKVFASSLTTGIRPPCSSATQLRSTTNLTGVSLLPLPSAKSSTLCQKTGIKAKRKEAFVAHESSVVLTEAKTMYAGGDW